VVENEFSRAVTRDGNRKAQRLVAEVFELRRSFAWRGLGELPYSALRIRKEFADFDAERRFALATRRSPTIRPASAARSCAASSGRRTAGFSAACAPRKTPSARAWCRRKAPVRRTIRTAVR
jgi:hydrogenase expression/formation protein HypD